MFVTSLHLCFSHSCFGSVQLHPLSHNLPCCALNNFHIQYDGVCLLLHRGRGFVKIYCPISPPGLFNPFPVVLCESFSSSSLILHPGDSLCCSKWFTSLISPLLVTLTLSQLHPPSLDMSLWRTHSVPVSLALNLSVSLSL